MATQSILPAVILITLIGNSFAVAQQPRETDPRFEKLAKDYYPKAKQEGALVVSMKRRSAARSTLSEAPRQWSRRNKPPSMPKRRIRQRRSSLPNG